MRLSEYSDDELIEEIKHRGIKICVRADKTILMPVDTNIKVIIGGVVFDLKT